MYLRRQRGKRVVYVCHHRVLPAQRGAVGTRLGPRFEEQHLLAVVGHDPHLE